LKSGRAHFSALFLPLLSPPTGADPEIWIRWCEVGSGEGLCPSAVGFGAVPPEIVLKIVCG